MDYPVKYNFSEEFFRDEDRCGFTVSECMKRYWAASLKSLEIFDAICSKYGLKYWADCGTMLGAIRHKGFIPWDDDLDIGMLREDFNRFLEIAADELPSHYSVSFKDDPPRHNYNGIAVVNSLKAVSFDPAYLSEYYFCPFPVGFDIYPYDYVPGDKNARDAWRGRYLKVLLAFNLFRERKEGDADTCAALKELGIDPAEAWKSPEEIRSELLKMAESIAGENKEDCGPFVNRFFFLATRGAYMDLPADWYKDLAIVPFETGTIPVLRHIDEAVVKVFGNGWITPVMNSMSHDYPLYKRDIRFMIKFLEGGGMKLSALPPMLQYIRREADRLGIEYKS